jgi:hypothetical protein
MDIQCCCLFGFSKIFKQVGTVASKKKNGRQNQALTQWKMLHCKTEVNIITYHHAVGMTLIYIFSHFFDNFLT